MLGEIQASWMPRSPRTEMLRCCKLSDWYIRMGKHVKLHKRHPPKPKMIRRDAQQLFLMTSNDILANISNMTILSPIFEGFFSYGRKPQTICLENFCDSSLAFFAVSIISIQGWTAHLHSYFSPRKPHFLLHCRASLGEDFFGTLGGVQCPAGNSKNLLKKKDAEKNTDLTCIPCDKVVCMQPASYIFNCMQSMMSQILLWVGESAMLCVYIYRYISYIKVQNGSRLCFPYIRTTVSWKVGKSQRWILFQQNQRHVKYSLWLDTPATNLSI